MTREVRAIPAYTAKDYPLIRQLSDADDMPATWEEWHAGFEASKAERFRRREFTHAKVLIRPGKFKGWLDDKSLSASEHTRQLYAQERLDTKRARREAQRALERMPIIWPQPPRHYVKIGPILTKSDIRRLFLVSILTVMVGNGIFQLAYWLGWI